MKKIRPGQKIKLTSVEELLGVSNEESAMDIEVVKIQPFRNHPFKVIDDEKMEDLVESIRANGILSPVLIRPIGNDVYEMVSGHRKETGEIQKVAMVDAPKETKTSTPSSGGSSSTSKGGSSTPSSSSQRQCSNPETGDTTNVVLWVVLMIVAGVFAGFFWYVKRKMDKASR